MHQFIRGTADQFVHLGQRARRGTVTFPDQPLPPGTAPASGRVGFSTAPDGRTTLLVDVCRRPPAGGAESVRDWLTHGGLEFDGFDDCVAWIRGELAESYGVAPRGVGALTDLGAVTRELGDEARLPMANEALLREALQASVRGQDAAVGTLAHRVSLHTARAEPRRPLTLFAVGPTGVGKTLAGEVLREALAAQGVEYAYLRLDMSEYQESHRVSQLLGAPVGYIGYEDGSALLDALGARPRTIVHFDEIEKAHPVILRALMNAMDAGRLTAAGRTSGPTGRTTDCRQAIFYFTSNLDADGILAALDETSHTDLPHVVDEVCRCRIQAAGVAPELVGRIHGFLAFRPLGRAARAEAAALSVQRVAEEYGARLARIDPSVLVHLLTEADEGFGARPLEYLADALLGRAFADAARRYGRVPVVVGGPPFRCRLVGDGDPALGPDVRDVDLRDPSLN